MSLRVDKDNIYFVLPESRYSVSNRIDKYMEEDFTLFIKTKIITDNLETEKEAFLIARNGMHSGISVYKDAFDSTCIAFTYWFKDKENTPSIKQVNYRLDETEVLESNEYMMICDNFTDRKIDCYVNRKLVGSILFEAMERQSYENGFYWLGCGSMIGPEEHRCVGEFDIDMVFLLNKKITMNEVIDLLDNYKTKYTHTVHKELKKLNKDFYLKENFGFFSEFSQHNRYKIWDISFNGNNPQLYFENNIYF